MPTHIHDALAFVERKCGVSIDQLIEATEALAKSALDQASSARGDEQDERYYAQWRSIADECAEAALLLRRAKHKSRLIRG